VAMGCRMTVFRFLDPGGVRLAGGETFVGRGFMRRDAGGCPTSPGFVKTRRPSLGLAGLRNNWGGNDSAATVWGFAILTFGAGWHNNHHAHMHFGSGHGRACGRST